LTAEQFDRKALLWNIAAKVTLTATAALMTVALASGMIGTTLLPPLSAWAIVGLVIGTAACFHTNAYCNGQAHFYANNAKLEHGVANQMKKIEDWNDIEIKNFLLSVNIRIEDSSLRRRLPLIGRFLYLKQIVQLGIEYCHQNNQKALEWLKNPPKGVPQEAVADACKLWRQEAHEALESSTLPTILKCAELLERMAQIAPLSDISTPGRFVQKSFEERIYEKLYDGHERFYYFTDPSHPPIERSELIAYFTSNALSDLRERIYTHSRQISSSSTPPTISTIPS
jgi:hypothetical protein